MQGLDKTASAFVLFSQAIMEGQSGAFFSDYSPHRQAEFYMGFGDYNLLDFSADKFPVFSVIDWLGENEFHYDFAQYFDHEQEIPDGLTTDLASNSNSFKFSVRTDQAVAWQDQVRAVMAKQTAGEAWVLNLAHDYVAGSFEDLATIKKALLCLFRDFLQLNKAHSAGLVITNEQIFCSMSPELFIRQQDEQILTSPIKGTGTIDYLETSAKERSELDMVTDLLRNDLGRICTTVKVLNERFLVAEKNFFSARSLITGTYQGALQPDDYRRLLPAGSISGAPKKRVVEIIQSLEKFDRGFYTGTFGVRREATQSIWNILIRTVFVDVPNQRWSFPVGVGITAESDPVAEWNETWQKAKLLTDLSG